MKSSNIGGQAVMEGIMMRHKDKYSIAVRRPDQEIELKVEDYKCTFGNHAFLKKPIIRDVNRNLNKPRRRMSSLQKRSVPQRKPKKISSSSGFFTLR